MERRSERVKGTARYGFDYSVEKMKREKNNTFFIYLFFNYGKVRIKHSTGYKCSYEDWDYARQRVKNRSGLKNKDEINRFLNNFEQYVSEEYGKLSLKHKKVPRNLLKKRLLKFDIDDTGVEQQDVALSFFQIINQYIEEKEKTISVVTARAYQQTKKQLEEYEKKKRQHLDFDTIDMNFYYDFVSFLENKGFYLNTIGKHIKTFKTFCSYAFDRGYTRNLQYKNKDFKILREITTEIYLTEEELTRLYEKDLSNYPEHEQARDIFLIGCHTGQRVSDYNNFTKDDIVERDGINYFKIKQKKNRKSGRTVLCPITAEIRSIMEKRYNGLPPKPMPEPFINKFIKEVAQDVGIDEMVKCEYTRAGKIVREMIPKHKLIKTHTARRSFCTNKYKAGMNVFDIMLFSGHTTEKEFYKYIRIKDEERAYHIAQNGFFNL